LDIALCLRCDAEDISGLGCTPVSIFNRYSHNEPSSAKIL